MIPGEFDYLRAMSVDHAIGLLTQHGEEAKLLCGGHSLLPLLKLRMARPSVQGGIVQGISQALLEEVVFGDGAQPLTSTLVDYSVPSAADMPDIETYHIEIPTTGNPLGAKGLGEAGATAAPQAVVNAVVDALAHLGTRTLDMPLTPAKVWRALNAGNLESI